MSNVWWKESVVYQIYPKSFCDSNGDGMGDIKGITQKLDYIKELGVNVIWICPVYQSPMDDNGYDISDYYQIDSMFGTNEDMEELIFEAKKRNLRILMDLVVNHTSDEHPWFQEALQNPKSKYADYYIFKEGTENGPPNNFRTYFGGPAWEPVEGSNRYYLHAFGKKQPDLNWENDELREEIYQMVNFWLEKGISGFRIDAIGNLKKTNLTEQLPPDGPDGMCSISKYILNQPGIEVWLNELRERTFQCYNSMTVAEADVPEDLLPRFIGENGFFSMVFDFSYADIDVPGTGEWYTPTNWTVAQMKECIFRSQLATQRTGWGAVYLENHDQPRSINKYLPEGDIGYESITMLANLFMMLRGTPFIYQGQEIGMSNVPMETLEDYNDLASHDQYQRARNAGVSHEKAMQLLFKRSRDNSRTPMQWSDEKNAGFSQGQKTWIKVNPNYKEVNVLAQTKKEKSILKYYQQLIDLRTQSAYQKIIQYGILEPLETVDSVIAYERIYEGQKLLVVNHFGSGTCSLQIEDGYIHTLIHNYNDLLFENGTLNLRPYESMVLARQIE